MKAKEVMFKTVYHRNGDVTFWSVYLGNWKRTTARALFDDDRHMASLGPDRPRIEALAHGMTLTEARALARRINALASDEGTLQAEHMQQLTRNHMLHTSRSMDVAARALGCYYALQEVVNA